MRRQRCVQCWQDKPWPEEFIGRRGHPVKWCRSCQERKGPRGSYMRAPARLGLPTRSPLRALLKRVSQNRKLGGIPCSITTASTCPPTCGLFGEGCYAEFNYLAAHWRRVSARGGSWRSFCREVAALPPGQLWRHNEAGDLPGVGNRIARGALRELLRANAGKRGFTFTHKPMTAANQAAIREALAAGFVVNLSADSLAQADRLAALAVAPVTVVVPQDAPATQRTPAGRQVVVCLAETHGLTCAECQLCAVPTRRGIVGFRAHGQMRGQVSQLVTISKKRVDSGATAVAG